MKALVINLDREIERLEFQSQQLASLGLEFQRVPAIKISDKQNELYKKYYKSWQRSLSISEVSCFFSHKKAWEIIVSEDQPMLILEDDAWLADNVPCVLQKLATLEKIDYATLEVTGAKRKKLIAKKSRDNFCGTRLFRLYQGRSGAGGYVLWPSGAKKLIARANHGNIGLADKFINASYSLLAYQIEPALVLQLDQCQYFDIKPPLEVKTTIVNKTSSSTTLVEKIIFRTRRVAGEIKVGINFLLHFNGSSRRQISLSGFFKKK